jgi:hypothetical protein
VIDERLRRIVSGGSRGRNAGDQRGELPPAEVIGAGGGATSHRKTGLVLAGGRVTEPKPIPDDEDAYVLDMSGG